MCMNCFWCECRSMYVQNILSFHVLSMVSLNISMFVSTEILLAFSISLTDHQLSLLFLFLFSFEQSLKHSHNSQTVLLRFPTTTYPEPWNKINACKVKYAITLQPTLLKATGFQKQNKKQLSNLNTTAFPNH